MVWVKRWGLVVLALAVVLPWLGETDVAIVGNEIVVPATSPERVMEGCTPKGKDLSPGADLRIGVKEKGDCDGTTWYCAYGKCGAGANQRNLRRVRSHGCRCWCDRGHCGEDW